jgi:hypothetical protein
MEGRPDDDREERERRAAGLRRRIQDLVGSEPGERPPPRNPHEFIEERMREEDALVERGEGGPAEEEDES